ncbi:MAG TPA: translation initiation factor IF-2 [candidate division WOR-3 bacterium]|uniref:Translation initiation factor IF-2 n=1 Tax=candidate division WOR-3 bacterium TaxID=2052148 RepID=A0A7C1B3Z7_UNCW3|nr:translation initiation factor IF-2 [candidate division WOR-3 bacterium]
MSKDKGKKRVADLANQLGLSNKALISLLKELGFNIRSPMSPVSEDMEKAVRRKIEETKREHQASLERKKKIWGETTQSKKPKQGERKRKRFDREKIHERVKETLAQIERGQAKPKRKKTYREKSREVVEEKRVLKIPGKLTVGELARMLGVEATELIKRALEHGIIATINQALDIESIMVLSEEFGYEIEVGEEEILEEIPEEEEELEPRPPVVTVMGHVDHGKTTLLDYIRKTNVAMKEAGAITQHIGAYTAEYQGHKITFIDTPGHEAFTALRQRGANATDIVILVVAATEGVKPQTIEAINHARAARVPIIVAINKMDLPEADPEKVKRQLAEQGLIPEEWGGDTMMVEISAKTGQGVDTLLEAVLLKAEELNLRAPYKGRARGIILESRLDRGKGPVATVLVQRGTLKVGDALVAGTSYGRVRAMYDEWGNRLKEITPSTPALVQGFEELPTAGDIFYVVDTEKEARRIAEEKKELKKTQISRGEIMMTARRLQEKILAGELKELPIVVKADCQGSLEAIGDVLSQMVFEEIKARVIHQGIGNVTESDVLLASASEGIIVAFNVGIEANARQLAKSEGVLIKTYKVIYELIDDVRNILAGLLEPEIREVSLGQAEVRETFKIPKIGTVAGCYVLQGVIQRDALARVRRDGEVIFEGRIASLKRFKEDVREVQAGYECGIRLEGFDKIKVGDIIEAFKKEEVKKELV